MSQTPIPAIGGTDHPQMGWLGDFFTESRIIY